MIWPLMRDYPKRAAGKKEWIATLNFHRDWLKHGGSTERISLDADDAAFAIGRAINKFDGTSWSEKMREFADWISWYWDDSEFPDA